MVIRIVIIINSTWVLSQICLKLRYGIIPFIKNVNENVDFNLCFHSDDNYFLESVLWNYIKDGRQSFPDFDDRTSILDKLEHDEKVYLIYFCFTIPFHSKYREEWKWSLDSYLLLPPQKSHLIRKNSISLGLINLINLELKISWHWYFYIWSLWNWICANCLQCICLETILGTINVVFFLTLDRKKSLMISFASFPQHQQQIYLLFRMMKMHIR